MLANNSSAKPYLVNTVLGPLSHLVFGITDAHNHVWIEPVPGAEPNAPILNQKEEILQELIDFKDAGGATILDCQPGGCGRNGLVLEELSRLTGVNIIACTGFHRKKYYPADYWLWKASPDQCAAYFIDELESGLLESRKSPNMVKAGFIKIALENTLESSSMNAVEGAAIAARQTCTSIEIHTEKGAQAEEMVAFMVDKGVDESKIILCHMDKRADIGLHKELAQSGALLEYDTFFRPKYSPEEELWPLIIKMVEAGLAYRVTLATDMAESEMYYNLGKGPGLASLPGLIRSRLTQLRIPENYIQLMMGENISRRLAGLT